MDTTDRFCRAKYVVLADYVKVYCDLWDFKVNLSKYKMNPKFKFLTKTRN